MLTLTQRKKLGQVTQKKNLLSQQKLTRTCKQDFQTLQRTKLKELEDS